MTIFLIAALFIRLYPRISTVQQFVHQFRMALPYYAVVAETLDAVEAAAERETETIAVAKGIMAPPMLALKDVEVSYGQRHALRGITLNVPACKTVAFAGASGAGKSTLVDVLLHLVKYQAGTIEVDGKDLSHIDLAWWRRSVGYVPQDTFLFNATIRENIAFTQPDISLSEIRAAARKAHLLEFIESLPDKFETIVGDRGVMLSGGQRQRVGIARALAGGKSLLILDEATAALDSETEAAIVEDISALHGEMTIIIIAHRLSTLKTADYIFVLEEGRIVESGSWSQLVSQQGVFHRLWDMQTEAPDSRRVMS